MFGSTNSLGHSSVCLGRGRGARHGAIGAGDHACAEPGAVAGRHSAQRSAGAARRGDPAAAVGAGPRDVLAPGSLDVGRRELGLVPGPICRAAGPAGGVGARALGRSSRRAATSGSTAAGRVDDDAPRIPRGWLCRRSWPCSAAGAASRRNARPRSSSSRRHSRCRRRRSLPRARRHRRRASWSHRRPSAPDRWSGSRAIGC